MLAHADLERISEDSLWDITRGLEDFNSIIKTVRFTNSQENSLPSNYMHNTVPHHMIALRNNSLTGIGSSASSSGVVNFEGPGFDAVIHNSYKNIGDTIKPIPFFRVLSILAKERSKYTAVLTHQMLTSNEDFLHLIRTVKKTDFSWIKDTRVSGAVKWQSDKSHLAPSPSVNTSDYHSASGSSFSASFSSNSLPRLGKVVLPTMNKDVLSVGDMTEREQEFAARFLQIVCHSTNFVKRSVHGRHFKVTVEASPTKTPTKLKAQSGIPSNSPSPLASPSDSPTPSSAKSPHSRDGELTPNPRRRKRSPVEEEPERKSVCFADSADYSVMVQLTQKYMDLLWQCFSGHLHDYFCDLSWGGAEAYRTHLGSLLHCDDIVVLLVVKMLQQISSNGKNIFRSSHMTTLVLSSIFIFVL